MKSAVKKAGSKTPHKVKIQGKSKADMTRKSSSRTRGKTNGKGNRTSWPNERQILWRPGRFTYIQGQQTHTTGCVFCDAKGNGKKPESLLIFDDGTSMVVLNKFPYNNGHLLVLPTRHVADIEDLSQEEFEDIHELIRRCVSALRKAYEKAPAGMNVGANLGAAAGAGIPQHLHYHVIPRWIGDANFFPLVGQTKVISETLEQTYMRLLPYFK